MWTGLDSVILYFINLLCLCSAYIVYSNYISLQLLHVYFTVPYYLSILLYIYHRYIYTCLICLLFNLIICTNSYYALFCLY